MSSFLKTYKPERLSLILLALLLVVWAIILCVNHTAKYAASPPPVVEASAATVTIAPLPADSAAIEEVEPEVTEKPKRQKTKAAKTSTPTPQRDHINEEIELM